VVEDEGVRRWLMQHGGGGLREAHLRARQRRALFLHLLADTREQLAQLYCKEIDREQLLRRKHAILDGLRDDYAQLKGRWGGYAGYDRWFARPLNNAHFASINTYHALEPAFRRILQRVNGDMAAFHAECREIAAMPAEERKAVMQGLLEDAGGRRPRGLNVD
jgi:predicted aminopeptidase